MRESFIEKIYKFIINKFIWILIILTLLIAATPFLLWGIFKICDTTTDFFSLDGLLMWCGAIFGSISTVLVAFIALYQSKKSSEAEELLCDITRRRAVSPLLLLSIEKLEENNFKIEVKNKGENIAVGIYLFDNPLFAVLEKKQSKTAQFTVGAGYSKIQISNETVKINKDGYPEKICLFYLDMDKNLISQDFQYDGSKDYNSGQLEYY